VAINLLFAPSSIFGTDADARVVSDVELDVTVYGDLGGPLLTPSLLQQEVGDLLGAPPAVDVEHRPLAGAPRRCLEAFEAGERCRPETDPAVYPADADFFMVAERERRRWQDGSAGYEAPGFVYATPRSLQWAGFADDNWTDGTRTAAYSLPSPERLDFGFGPTSTLIHEYGHHFGVSHPHDGYETEWGPYAYQSLGGGLFFFAWAGDEVSTVMSYLFLNNDFSQFDLDNHHRFQAVRYLRAANLIAADVVASGRAGAGAAALECADASFTAAQEVLSAHDYPAVAARAADGYRCALQAAAAAQVPVPSADRWAIAAPGRWQSRRHDAAELPGADPAEAMLAVAHVPADLLAAHDRARSGG
jgi:hypothetical protein